LGKADDVQDKETLRKVLFFYYQRILILTIFFFTQVIDELSDNDDYIRCLKHKAGVFDPVPEDVQIKIHDFANNHFLPDVLDYLGTKNPIFCRSAVHLVEEYGFEFESYILEDYITNEERYDLWLLDSIFRLPRLGLTKLEGKRFIGAAIRICKAIGKPEHAKKFNDIVGEFFSLPMNIKTRRIQTEDYLACLWNRQLEVFNVIVVEMIFDE
jgi:hypothetical protein